MGRERTVRVLLTGASGFIGQHVLAALRQQGIDPVVVGRTPVPNVATENFIQADLLTQQDFSGLVRAARASHLLHLAWYAEHGKYWTSPLNLRWVEATVRLAEAFYEGGGQSIVAAGTCAEYDWASGYCREDASPLAPATLYGVTKDATRRLLMALAERHQRSCAWGRIFFPYGRGEPATKLVPALEQVFRGRQAAFGVNAQSYRDFLHASDVASAFLVLLKAGVHGACNISSGEPVRLRELVVELARLCGGDARAVLELEPARKNEPALVVGDGSRLRALGWQPKLSLAEGLRASLSG